MGDDMKDQEGRAELNLTPIEPQLALKSVDQVVDQTRKIHSRNLALIAPVMALALFTAACIDVEPATSIQSPPIPTTAAAGIEKPPVFLTPIKPPETSPAVSPSPTAKLPTVAAGGEITRPSQIPLEVWNQLTNEQRQVAAKEIKNKVATEDSQREREVREEKARKEARAAAEEAARKAEYDFNQEITQNKTPVSSPTEAAQTGWKIIGDILGTVGKVATVILPPIVLFGAVVIGVGRAIRLLRHVIPGGGGGGRGRPRYGP